MPPKSASRGGPRRVTYPSARRSAPQQAPLDQSPPAVDAVPVVTPLETPSSNTNTASPSLIVSVPGSGTPSTSPNDAVLDAPTSSVQPPSNDVVSDPDHSQNPQGLGNPNSAGVERESTAVETSESRVGDGGGGGGGKTKRVVKKTIKVVRKIIKRFPRRIVKVGSNSRVDELEVPEANDDGLAPMSSIENSAPSVPLSMETNKLQKKVDLCEQSNVNEQNLQVQAQNEGASLDVDENVDGAVAGCTLENSAIDVSLSMEVEKLPQKGDLCDQNMENMKNLEVQAQNEVASTEVDKIVDENSGIDVSLSMEVEKLQQKVDLCHQNIENRQNLEVQPQNEVASTEVDKIVDENSGIDVSLSMEVEKLQQKVCLCHQNIENKQNLEVQAQNEVAFTEVDKLVDENSGIDVSLSMEVEKLQQKVDLCHQNIENKQNLEVQALNRGSSMEVDENVDSVVDGGNIENSGTDTPEEPFTAARDGEKGTEELEVKEDPSGAPNAEANTDRNEGKRADVVEDGDNVAKPEDEMGDGLCYSGEMEALKRRKRRKREVFLGGLDKDAKEEDIRKVFEEVGKVLEVRLMMNGNTGKNKGYAFLLYASAVDAKKALEKFSAVEICGKQCSAQPLEGNDTIYLGGIDKKWKDEDIAKLLQEMGTEGIDTILVMKDPENKECNRGYAFVEFETCRYAQVAFKKLQKNYVFGKNSKMKVDWAGPLSEPNEAEIQKVKTVYAEYLPSTWDEEKVKENFEKFGETDNIVLARNLQNAKRKDYAFINYKTREAAIACIESYKHQPQNDEGTKINVKVSLARPVSRSKQPKQIVKPISREIPKERSKPKQGNVTVRRIDPRNNAANVISRQVDRRYNAANVTVRHIDPRNDAASVIVRQIDPRNNAANVIVRQIDPRYTGVSSIPHYDFHRPELRQTVAHRDERASTNSELVQLLREQASWRPPHAGPHNVGHSTTFSGRKRPVSTLDPDPVYSDMSGYPNYRLQTTLPSISRYGAYPQSGTSASSAYYQGQANYAADLPYSGARNYLGSEPRDRAHGSSSLFRRY